MIYVVLSVLVLGIVGSLLLNGLTGERIVRNMTDATTAGQLSAESIQTGIRNSSDFTVFPDGANQGPLLAIGDELVLARVAKSGPISATNTPTVWQCKAWYFSKASGELRYFAADSAVVVPATEALLQGDWSLLASGVAVSPGPVFAKLGRTLNVKFQVSAGDRDRDPKPVVLRSSANSRADLVEAAPCF